MVTSVGCNDFMNWIDVKEKLPEPMQKALVVFNLADTPQRFTFVAYRDCQNEWNLYQLFTSFPVNKTLMRPTHWMPLPELPHND
jgi:hypothetical protein